jgi:hypothetical protein
VAGLQVVDGEYGLHMHLYKKERILTSNILNREPWRYDKGQCLLSYPEIHYHVDKIPVYPELFECS